MKNLIPAVLSVLFLATAAHAEIPCDFGFYDFDSSVCALKLITFSPTLSTFALNEGKSAVVEQIQDDAASFVASSGTVSSSVLKEAMDAFRSQNAAAASMSDREVATLLLRN